MTHSMSSRSDSPTSPVAAQAALLPFQEAAQHAEMVPTAKEDEEEKESPAVSVMCACIDECAHVNVYVYLYSYIHMYQAGVSNGCKLALDPITQDQQILWWDQWTKRWDAEFEVSARIWDEEAQTNEARRVRKACKDAKISKDETAKRVEEALVQLGKQGVKFPDTYACIHILTAYVRAVGYVVPPCLPPKYPHIEDTYPQEQVELHGRRVTEAGRRLDAIRHKMDREDKSDNEAAVSKATLADAKLKVLGKKTKVTFSNVSSESSKGSGTVRLS